MEKLKKFDQKKKFNFDVFKVESFLLSETTKVTGGSGGSGGSSGAALSTLSTSCPTFDTTGKCCIQNDNS